MAIAVLMEAPGDAHPGGYDAVNEKMDLANNPPDGMIVHTAGRAENGSWRIFDVWESQDAYDRFNETRLTPALREVFGDEMVDNGPSPEFYELYNLTRP